MGGGVVESRGGWGGAGCGGRLARCSGAPAGAAHPAAQSPSRPSAGCRLRQLGRLLRSGPCCIQPAPCIVQHRPAPPHLLGRLQVLLRALALARPLGQLSTLHVRRLALKHKPAGGGGRGCGLGQGRAGWRRHAGGGTLGLLGSLAEPGESQARVFCHSHGLHARLQHADRAKEHARQVAARPGGAGSRRQGRRARGRRRSAKAAPQLLPRPAVRCPLSA